jgi:hypothetical protein
MLADADYDGTTPFTGSDPPPGTFQGRVRAAGTAAFAVVPFAGLGVAVWLAWGHGLNLADVLLAAVLSRRRPHALTRSSLEAFESSASSVASRCRV